MADSNQNNPLPITGTVALSGTSPVSGTVTAHDQFNDTGLGYLDNPSASKADNVSNQRFPTEGLSLLQSATGYSFGWGASSADTDTIGVHRTLAAGICYARGDGFAEPIRGPRAFKTVQATANGSTALWTPAAGKKFRLMRYMISVSDNAIQAGAGVITVSLLDAAGAIGQAHDIYVPAIALVNSGALYTSPWIDLGNGVLSGAANNVLNVNLSSALTGGNVRVICCGTEE